MAPAPRVTLGIATYERDSYLAEAVASCLRQDAPGGLEVLVVVDGGRNPRIEEVLGGFDDPRLRIVRHEANRGIAEAYNTIVREGRGELIAMLGDDDVCEPDRIARQVAVFDAHPGTGVVVGDAIVIDGAGRRTGEWNGADLPPRALLDALVRRHNHLVDPSRMVHRRVHDAVGGYDARFGLAQDFDFWLRAAPRFRIRHCPGGPLVRFRRHGANTSDESARDREVADVELALAEAIEREGLREIVPELDWDVLHPLAAERRALEVLADALERRVLPLPGLAARLRGRAAATPPAPVRPRNGRRILMTSFGFNDSGGGTTVPRLVAKELAVRGWDVTVFHAATQPLPGAGAYALSDRVEDGVRLIGVHNREHGLWDLGNPHRELDDPPITQAFARVLDDVRPHVAHVHNLHNLGAALLDELHARGIPTYFSTHNYWLVCPRAYLLTGDGAMCAGPGERGASCATCVGSSDRAGHAERLAGIRERFTRAVDRCFAVSEAVRRTLLAQGYPADLVDVVRQGVPAADAAWERLGRDRVPGRSGDELTVAFFGSAYPHKGPQLLVEAAQHTRQRLRVLICGEVPARFADALRRMDHRGVVELRGAFSPSELPSLLAEVDAAVVPSMWWDCAPLMAAECLAGRVPLVAPRLGGLGEAVRHEVDGLLFDGLDARSLTAALDRLSTEAGLLERLQAGIEAPRSFAEYVDELEARYDGRHLAAPAPPPAEPAVTWTGRFGDANSLATINDEVTARLGDHGVRVQRRMPGEPVLDGPLPHAADVEVRHGWPPDLRPARSGRLAVIQPWEFGAIPADWVVPIERDVDEVWVPSEFCRRMYVDSGITPDRVRVVPNGVDLDVFTPAGPVRDLGRTGRTFLFLGPPMPRKGCDLLLDAWRAAFAGREDVTLVWKDVGVGDTYKTVDRTDLLGAVADDPRIVHLTEDLDRDGVAALLRCVDVLVLPYRGEGFAMPVLEAMACGTPVICTAGGPTDEFCPPDAGWKVAATRVELSDGVVDGKPCAAPPWLLEPDLGALVRALRAAADAPGDELAARGAAGHAAAQALGWDSVAARYAARLRALAARPPKLPVAPDADLEVDASRVVLATPAWRGEDRLAELLHAWADGTSEGDDVALVLVADPGVDGDPAALEARVLGCGADLGDCAEITIHLATGALPGRDAALHVAADAYVPLHGACAGHARAARAAGSDVVAPDALAGWLARTPAATL